MYILYPPASACRGHQAGKEKVLSHRSMLFLSFIDVIFQESFQHSIHSLMLYFKNPSNIPSAIAI